MHQTSGSRIRMLRGSYSGSKRRWLLNYWLQTYDSLGQEDGGPSTPFLFSSLLTPSFPKRAQD